MATFTALGGIAKTEPKSNDIRRQIVDATRKRNPRTIYIPADGGEEFEHCEFFKQKYSSHGCKIEFLTLLRDRPSLTQMKKLLESADLIFISGGNTLRMMRMWKRFGVDRELIKAAKRNIVIAGVSAGAISMFEYGHSDSRSFSGKPDWKYIRVKGLGLLPGTFCPHVLGENRLEKFAKMMAKHGGLGYGLNDGTGLMVHNGNISVIGDRKGAFCVTGRGGQATIEP